MVTGKTKVIGIIGSTERVQTSLSPAIHNSAFRAMGLDWTYVGFPCEKAGPRLIKDLVNAGVAGLNVTMPHKVVALRACSQVDEFAEKAGAVNTIVDLGG